MTDVSRFDIAIVGAGPAGLMAALAASQHTSSIAVIDQATAPGGQIWRHDVNGPPSAAEPIAARAFERATFIGSSSVIDATTSNGRHRLLVERDGAAFAIESATVILATGARELFLPFPGWTLPGVVGVGGLQALMKSGYSVRGKRIVVAGTGPLLVAVAAAAARKGADVVAVVEQASVGTMLRFGARLALRPRIALDALGYLQELQGGALQVGRWVTAAAGSSWLDEVTVTDGVSAWKVECDLLATGYGLVPNTELGRRLGCAVDRSGIVVDDLLRTSVAGIFAAGECAGIGGVDVASREGTIAGLTAVGVDPASRMSSRAGGRRWETVLQGSFAPRREVLALARPETIVCRCEDVRLRDIDAAWSSRQAKLYTRAGMGACQGRVCGSALEAIFGWSPDTVRGPLHPASLSTLTAPAAGALSGVR